MTRRRRSGRGRWRCLFDFFDPEHARRHAFRGPEGVAQIALGFALELVVEGAEIHAQHLHAPFAGQFARREAFAAAMYAQQHQSAWTIDFVGHGVEKGSAAHTGPALQIG